VAIEDIHEFVTELEKKGELKRVKTEVDSNLEIAEILRRECIQMDQPYFLKM